MDPKVLLLDEPTSALDTELSGEVIATIRSLSEQMINLSKQELVEELWDSDRHIHQSLKR